LLKQSSTSSRKVFEHQFYEFEQLEAIMVEGKRYYKLPDGSLAMSVTTVLGSALDKTGLMEWRKRVGEEEANRISTQAATRGTAIHLLAERYLLNEDRWARDAMPSNIFSFNEIRPILDANIGKIYAIEAPLYSIGLRAAGRSDCIADWNGVPSIIDFKTSRRPKEEKWIESYFLQATTYAMMMEERTGLAVKQFAIVIAVDGAEPQVFVKDIAPYRDRVLQIFQDRPEM
jgi:genome maintenance exonuclease 1